MTDIDGLLTNAGLRVRELEWLEGVAETPFGAYWILVGYDTQITLGAPKWSSKEWRKYPTAEKAMAAAQADFTARILSSVSPGDESA